MPLKLPPIYLLRANFENDAKELHRLETEIDVVFNLREARVVLGKITQKKRAALELRKLGYQTRDVAPVVELIDTGATASGGEDRDGSSSGARKRRKLNTVVEDSDGAIVIDSGSETEDPNDEDADAKSATSEPRPTNNGASPNKNISTTLTGSRKSTVVLKLAWYTNSLKSGKLLPYDDYLIYEFEILSKSKPSNLPPPPPPSHNGTSILARAREDTPPKTNKWSRHTSRPISSQHSSQPALLHETTTENDESRIPLLPSFCKLPYSCQRPTLLHCPNDDFLHQLRIIKKFRLLDKEVMRALAYSKAIASIAAYPYRITSRKELLRLPNCDKKTVGLWMEWNETGHIEEINEIEKNERYQSLCIFYEIFDVGASFAKKFYDRGWRDLDDVVEKGWDELTRNQQIGVKHYDEFQVRIPRAEVEATAAIIFEHANRVREGFQMVICGGYRRGKETSGDIDVVLSHPDEEATDWFLGKLLDSLEEEEGEDRGPYIKYRLVNSEQNSRRGQSPVSWKGGAKAGGGFDTLDHAFIVWQHPYWEGMIEDLERDPEAQNPNPHRRVDIIVSPWKTAGCAVIGWSGGTQFERDLRLYVNHELGLKFDSSGARNRLDGGSWVNLEAGDGDLLVKERRVFEKLKLEWREPTERCTD